MAKVDIAATPQRIRARQITGADVTEVVDLLSRGFSAQRSPKFWREVLTGLATRSVPPKYPRYGYILESDGKPVGVFLQIFSTVWSDGRATTRCNVSSVYVEPAFRVYAPLFEMQAFKHDHVTVLDLTPGPSRYAVVQARGYTRYSSGVFISMPSLSRPPKDTIVRVLEAHDRPDVPIDAHERDLVLEHADFGCVSLWCVTPERAYPFVFRPRVLKGFLRCAQLVYCPSVDEFVRFARPLGMFLARCMQFFVMIDANGPIRGLHGKYFPGKMPRYFRGSDRPRLGDLAYTEIALFGI
jgi:hypothetical protein